MLSIFPCDYCPSVCLLWRNVYLSLLPIFWLGCLFVFVFLLSRMSCLYILEVTPLSVTSLANIFFQSIGCLFILFMVSFAVQKLISLIRSHLFILTFISIALVDWPKKTLVQLMSENGLPMFSSRSFLFVCLFVFLKNKFIYFLFIYFWLHWVFIAACGLSLVAASGGYSSLRCGGVLIAVASLVAELRL